MTELSPTSLNLRPWRWYLLSLITVALLLGVSLTWSIGYDQGTFAYGGSALLKGLHPYLDFWDIKPPNVFYVYALAFRYFGESIFAIRLFDYLNALLTVSLIWLLVKLAWNSERWAPIAGFFASIAYATEYLIQGFQDTAQAETYTLPLLLAALLLVLPRNSPKRFRSTVQIAIAGMLIALAFYFKFTNGIFLVPCGVVLLLGVKEKESKLRSIVILGAGFLIGFGIETITLAVQGELVELWNITTGSTIKYSQTNFSGKFGILQNIRTTLSILDPVWIIAGLVGWIILAIRKPRISNQSTNSGLLLVLSIFVGLAVVQLQNKGYKYHYQIILVWSAALIGVGCAAIVDLLWTKIGLPLGAFVLILAPLLFLGSCYTSRDQMVGVGILSKQAEIVGVGNSLVRYVSMHTKPTDKLFIFGFEPYVYWKSERTPATRFLNTIHFKPSYVAADLHRELISGLTNKPPELMLIETGDHYTSQGDNNDDSRSMIKKRYPEIENLLTTRYAAPDTIGDVLGYRLQHLPEAAH